MEQFKFRDACAYDAHHIGAHMRASDAKECFLMSGKGPEEALLCSIQQSRYAISVIEYGKPILAFGVKDAAALGDYGVIWMLSTKRVKEIPRTFVRGSIDVVSTFLRFYSCLENYVYSENHVSRRWLRWLGFKETGAHVISGETFYHFCRER